MSFPDHPTRPNDSAQTGAAHTGSVPTGSAHTAPATGGKPSSGLAIAALVLGILAVLLFWTVFGGIVLGLLALILGIIGVRKARRGDGGRNGMSLTGAILGGLGLLASAAILALGASVLGSDEFKNFDDCVERAQTQAERDACAKDFGKELDD
ncbi:DUF4190 domain-containing protein [Streptomyces sp. NPDC006339]|uniref:DUF4190 domain-containing protein n=1 Tax=Streptomyces sp. NPDC006339 TaxID=3156755 RepID=UPI0033BD3E87